MSCVSIAICELACIFINLLFSSSLSTIKKKGHSLFQQFDIYQLEITKLLLLKIKQTSIECWS